MPTVLESIATANPPDRGSQQDAAAFMQRIESLSPSLRRRIPLIYERSGIDFRYSCIPDYVCEDPNDFRFFPQNWRLQPPPTTRQRNAWYRDNVIPIAEKAAREAIGRSGFTNNEITHLIAVSCTGFFAPGIDIELVKALDLQPSTRRTIIGFMGCYAAFNAMRVADAICRAEPSARVLVVCAELCTLHFQVEDSLESAVVNALFSDGAAAAIMASRDEADAAGSLAYVGNHTLLDSDSRADMSWDIGDHGFLMGLSSRVPEVIAKRLPGYVQELTSAIGGRDRVGFWAIHPGGRAIVESAQEVLSLQDDDVQDSLEVLRLHGNMSSPTILFVLARILNRLNSGGNMGEGGIAMAFGPGLTLEGASFRVIGT